MRGRNMVAATRLQNLFRQMEQEMNDLQKRFERLLEEGPREITRPDQSYVWGWSLSLGPSGGPVLREFGNRPLDESTVEPGWRVPFWTMVMDAPTGELRVGVEMPGVRHRDVKVDAAKDHIRIEARRAKHRYRLDLPLKAQIDPRSATRSQRDGILELSYELVGRWRTQLRPGDRRAKQPARFRLLRGRARAAQPRPPRGGARERRRRASQRTRARKTRVLRSR